MNDLLSVATIPEIYVIRDTAWLFAREQQTMEVYLQGSLTSHSLDKSLRFKI